MANLFTDSFFRKQMGKIRAELGIDEAQIEEYIKTVQKLVAYIIDFNPETDSEERDWPGFEKDVFRDLLGYKIKDDDASDYHIFRQSKVKGAGKHGGTGKTDCTLGFYSKKKQRDGNDPVMVEFKAPDTKNLDDAADQLWNYMTRHENCRWGIVSNFNEITLYHRNRDRDRKQTFYFAVPEKLKESASPLIRFSEKNETEDDNKKSACISTDKDGNKYDCTELIKFLAIFRKDRLISEQGKSPAEEMLEMQGMEEKKIEKEFYEKYYQLRIDLFNEIALHNPQYRKNRAELVAITQKILDRLIFIWFCEDSREELLPRNILQRLIGSLMKKSPDLRSENDVWDEIKKLFKAVDDGKGFHIGNGYNGELFKPDSRIDELVIPGRIFEQQIKPIGEEYDFGHENELSVNILGHIFEQSVTDLEELKQEEPVDKKIGKRKREGVYYTPEYITRYITEQALGGWLAERRKELGKENLPKLTDEVKKKSPKKGGKPAVRKPKITEKMKTDLLAATGSEELVKKLGYLKTRFKDEAEFREILATVPEAAPYTDMIAEMAMPEDPDLANWYRLEKYWRSYREVLKNVKILDPACGSGAFLIQAFDFLQKQSRKVNLAMESLGLGSENIFDLDRQILENNLHGVDINDESVEITKLSLWLKTAVKHKKLNNLFNNIKCGNSLIDDSQIAGKKAFQWEKEFPEIMQNGGFDVVIGNPPYFNVQTFGAASPYMTYLQREYSDIWMDKSDILFYFIKKAIELSKSEICYIVSNAFLFSDKAQKLRNYILDNASFTKIINFEQFMIFQDASITSAIIHLNKVAGNYTTKVIILKNKSYSNKDVYEIISNEKNSINVTLKKNNVFALIDDNTDLLNQKIDSKGKKIGDLFTVGKGMETAADDIFTFKEYPSLFPSEFIKKRVTGLNTERYCIYNNTDYILYFEDIEIFDDLPESIRDYLLKNKIILEKRATVKNEGRIWWRYSRPMHKEYYHLPKLFCSRRSFKNTFSFDNSFNFLSFSNMTVIFETNKTVSIKYALTLLNSEILNFRYKSIGKQTGGGSFEYFPNGISKLTIPVISSNQQQPFIEKADTMLDLNTQLAEQKQYLSEYLTVNNSMDSFSQKLQHAENLEFTDFIKELKKKKVSTDDKTVYEALKDFHSKIRQLKSKIDQTDRETDQMVYDLYDLSEEERKIVEQACG